MQLSIHFGNSLCYAHGTLNGITFDSKDFGEQQDLDKENAEDYGCGNMTFTPKPPSAEILDKYKITSDEFNEIAELLAANLSFGRCGWCI